MLNQIGTGGKLFITQCACVWPVSEVEILVFHEDVFVAEATLAYITLIWLLPHMCEPNMADKTILVAKLLVT